MSLSIIHRNEVLLVGRIEAAPTERVLPSGEQVVSWRMAVQRPAEPERRTLAVDSVDCVAGASALARRSRAWNPGDIMEVTGSLRRRFWRGAKGVQSRCEVEVARARRIARAAPSPGAHMAPATPRSPGHSGAAEPPPDHGSVVDADELLDAPPTSSSA